MKVLKVLSVRRYKCGYEIRHELWDSECKGQKPWKITAAYTPDGEWIGDKRDAYRLVKKRGIQPQKSKPDHCVCSIGYSVKDGKWYGWSHRALYGFQIGSTCRKGDCHYLPRRHGGRGAWIAKTTADAKRMAVAFAEGVS